jgi:hypothetical protein
MDNQVEILNELKRLNRQIKILTHYVIPNSSDLKLETIENRINYVIGIYKNRFDDMEDLLELKKLLLDYEYLLTRDFNKTEIIYNFDTFIIPLIKTVRTSDGLNKKLKAVNKLFTIKEN